MYDDRTRHARHIIEEVRVPLRDPGAPTAGAQVDPVRRGAGPGEVDPPARPELARRGGLPSAGSDADRTRAWSAGRRRLVADRTRPAGEAGPVLDARRRARRWPATAGMPTVARSTGPDRSGSTPARAGTPVPAGKHALFSAATPAGDRERPGGRGPTRCRPGPPGRSPARRAASVSRVGLVALPAAPAAVRRLAARRGLRPVDDLPGLPAPDLDQRDPGPVSRRRDGARLTGRSGACPVLLVRRLRPRPVPGGITGWLLHFHGPDRLRPWSGSWSSPRPA